MFINVLLTFLIIPICLILFVWYWLQANHLEMHASENKEFNDHRMELRISCLCILIHRLHLNLLYSTLISVPNIINLLLLMLRFFPWMIYFITERFVNRLQIKKHSSSWRFCILGNWVPFFLCNFRSAIKLWKFCLRKQTEISIL